MIVTRFAPSPTGYLHIGGLRTALFNYLYAKRHGGKFLLRIEDTDMSRHNEKACEAILEAFKWVGLDYDNDIIYQSKRLEIYRSMAQKLLDNGSAYYCYMSKDELDNLREEQRQRGETPRYDRRYRDFHGTPPSGISPVIRIKAPLEGSICFQDALKGEMKINANEVDDYIIMRSDGTPTYNFVVAIDDALMEISDIIRGDDHLSNTPKQIIIYHALGLKVPRFCHIPMILNPQGKKLSKRDGALNVMEYKAMGILPQSLLNFLLRLGFSHGDKEIFSLAEMKELFNLESLSSAPSAYNESKLLWLNNHYIKELSGDELWNLCEIDCTLERGKKELLRKEVQTRCNTICECKEMIRGILSAPKDYDSKMRAKMDSSMRKILSEFALENASDISAVEAFLHEYASRHNIKLGSLLGALRCAILGKSGGIGMNEAICILGSDEVERRIRTFLDS